MKDMHYSSRERSSSVDLSKKTQVGSLSSSSCTYKDGVDNVDGFIKDFDKLKHVYLFYPDEINIVRIEGELVLNK